MCYIEILKAVGNTRKSINVYANMIVDNEWVQLTLIHRHLENQLSTIIFFISFRGH